MIFLRSSEHLPIGIDLGHHSIKLLQLQERKGRISVLGCAEHLIPEEMKVPGADRVACAVGELKRLSRQSGFVGRNVVVVLPRELVTVKTIRLPILSESELQSAIELEAKNLFPVSHSALTLRCIPAGEVKQGGETRLEVIVLAVETAAIESLLEQFNQIGLVVDSLDFESSAAYRGIERFIRRKEDENEVNVIVDVGAQQSQVVIGRGHEITFNKVIDIAGATLNDCVARKLSLSTDEAASLRRRFATSDPSDRDSVRQAVVNAVRDSVANLAHEVALCLRYYSVTFRGQRPSKVRLMGGESNDPMLRQAFAASLTVPVELYQPFQGVETGSRLLSADDASFCEWGVAFGAAMRRVTNPVIRAPDTGTPPRRRKTDEPLVEVVDLSSAIKTAGVLETSEPRARKHEEAPRA